MSNSFRRGRALALPTKAANEGALAPEVALIPKHVHNFGTYLVTTQTWGRRALFQCDELARQLAETLLHYREEKRYLLHEYVVMPNHLHAIITPNDITLERAMQLIKGGFSFKIRQTEEK